MVTSTRAKNKLAHPAAPIMTEAAKRKAGIKHKQRPKRVTKDETIRELQAQIAALKNPEGETFSKEPLFIKGSSPPPDMDEAVEPEIPTDLDSDSDQVFQGRKRMSSNLPDPRALKRSKAYSVLEDVRPTLRNKPSGLKADWYSTALKPSVPRQPLPVMHARSISSSSSLTFPVSPVIPRSPTPEPDHMSSLLAIFPPVFGKSPSSPSVQLYSLPRAFKDETGRKQQPGLKDLPSWLRENFRNLYIRRIIEWVGLSDQPWNNPCVASLEQEFYRVYSARRISSDDAAAMPLSSARQIRLHSDDAAVVPTLRDLGALRNQIGNEGLIAAIEYIPRQYTKRALESRDVRARYVTAVVHGSQRPFIWEYFRPGTIPLANEQRFYDEKRRGPFQSEPVLRAFSVYFGSYGVREPIPSVDPGPSGPRPIGALALAAAAVERGYRMHLTGDYVSNGSDFSSSKWLATTQHYMDMIQRDLSSEQWTAIFQALRRLQTTREKAAQVKIGAPQTPKSRDALLPSDPPTPPPLD